MIWKTKRSTAKRRTKQMWHKWFAWHPIRLIYNGTLYSVWWEWVDRKGVPWYSTGSMGWDWKYRIIPTKK